MAYFFSRIPVRLHGSSADTFPVHMLCNETWNTTNNPKNNSCHSSGSQHQEFCFPETILIVKETNKVYCELHKCFAPPPFNPLNQAPFLFCILQVVTHFPLGYCGRPRCTPNICRLLLLSYVALGDRTGGWPTGERGTAKWLPSPARWSDSAGKLRTPRPTGRSPTNASLAPRATSRSARNKSSSSSPKSGFAAVEEESWKKDPVSCPKHSKTNP